MIFAYGFFKLVYLSQLRHPSNEIPMHEPAVCEVLVRQLSDEVIKLA
jgi:hypothetical protein